MEAKAEVRPRPLKVDAIVSRVEKAFGDTLRSLKLDVLGTDDSPIPVFGYYTPCINPKVSAHFRLCGESLAPSSSVKRNNCLVPGTLVNTNNMLGFKNLDLASLVREEGKKILHAILSGEIEECPSLLLRFVMISFADLKNWKLYYDVAFPSLVFNSEMTLLSLHSASQVLNQQEATSLSKSMEVWRGSNETTVHPFFWLEISSDSSVVIRQLKDWKCRQDDGQKVLFGFYDNGCRQDYPGWALRNYIAFLSLWWKIEKVQFLCYREKVKGGLDLEKSLIGEASFAAPHGWDGSNYVPEVSGWEGETPGDGRREKKLKSIKIESPESQVEQQQLMHLKLMGWRHFPVDLDKLLGTRCLVLGAGALGCEVSRLLMTWGVRKLTVVDGGCVAIADLFKQSLYVKTDCGVPRATAIVAHLKERCPAVEVEGIRMEVPAPGNLVSPSVLDDCRRLQTLVAANDVVFLLTDTWEGRWFPTLLCAQEDKIAMTAAVGYDSYLVMRHGAGPGTRSGGTDDVIAQMQNLSTEDALGRPRLGCCFCNEKTSLFNSSLSNEIVALPGLTSIAAGKAVELFARIIHHPEGIHAPGDIAGLDTEHQLGLLPHQIQGSLPKCVLSTMIGNSSSKCTACSNVVLSEYEREGLDFIMKAINQPTYLKDLTGISNNLRESYTCLDLPANFPVNSGKLSGVGCLILGAGTLGCDVARILMDYGVRKLTVVDSGRVVVSNLARQSLYTYDDCDAPKAKTILEHLKERYPSSVDELVFDDSRREIPMPGHPVSDEEAAGVLEDCKKLQNLVATHDAVFLLTDTRESRWLPTLLCANENKIAITAALGYDSYLAMRHGAGPGTNSQGSNVVPSMTKPAGDVSGHRRLGCYFCNDVIAPIDSVSNRTLDQQCTVTRPGLASIASGHAADLFARMLNHPDGIHAPGDIAGTTSERPFGLLPHQIRGSLSNYNLFTLLGYSSSSCIACSDVVLSEFRSRGMDFVKQVINEPTYLERLTGLTELMKSADYSRVEWVDDFDNDDEFAHI